MVLQKKKAASESTDHYLLCEFMIEREEETTKRFHRNEVALENCVVGIDVGIRSCDGILLLLLLSYHI